MRQVNVLIYQFDELDNAGKEKAREWWRASMDFSWCDEAKASIRAFCDYFGAKLINWHIEPYSLLEYSIPTTNENFRGLKLSQLNRDHMPTGYYLDNDLWMTFYDRFKETGNAKKAFSDALEAGFKGWRADMENQMSDEYIDDVLISNGYEFTKEGKLWR